MEAEITIKKIPDRIEHDQSGKEMSI